MVFQSCALYPTMSVRENIAFGLKIRKMPQAAIDEEVARVARLLQIEHLLERKPSQLSGGQQQRVAMGRALARRPRSTCSTSRCPTSMPSCRWKCAPS